MDSRYQNPFPHKLISQSVRKIDKTTSNWEFQKENIDFIDHLVKNFLVIKSAKIFLFFSKLKNKVFFTQILEIVKNYFDYSVSTLCGLPEIELAGSIEDWIKIRKDAETLSSKFEKQFLLYYNPTFLVT